MGDIFSGVARPFSATAQIRYKNVYKRRLMDRCILPDIINANPEDLKGEVGRGKGTTVRIYVPGTVMIRDTQPDGGIIYQQVTDTYEDYSVTRESYWALKFRPEDMSFMPWDPKSTYFTNATDQMARHIEKKFGADIIGKVPSYNTGHTAGVKYGGFDVGAVGSPVALYKTQTQCDAATTVQYRDVAADYFVKLANVIKENEGLAGGHVNIIVPSVVKHHVQTSELKYGGLMGRNEAIAGRGEVKFLGTLDDTITLIQDNIMLPVFKDLTDGKNIYPILALMKDAVTYFDEVVFRDNAMKDIANWDEHYRAKQVYDWGVVFPQMVAVGYVKLAENAYSAG